jgi:hypothetical protein
MKINPTDHVSPIQSGSTAFRAWFQNRLVKPVLVNAGAVGLVLFAVLAAGQMAQAQTLLLQLKSPNYNPTNGLWTATVGPNAQGITGSATAYPTLTTNASPNGSPAVVFFGTNQMQLATSLPTNVSYTTFAYIKPAAGAGPYALFGGGAGAFEYRIYNSKQDALRQQQADLFSENTALSTSAFNLVDATVTTAGTALNGNFRLNGVADGTNAPSTLGFPVSISAIGARASSGGETFSGSVCEIDIYSGILTPSQISSVEAGLTASYVTIGPVLIIGLATVSPTNNIYAGSPVTLGAAISGATNTTTFQWQTDNGSSGASYANISGATTTNYVLNTTSLNGVYQYRLIGTPSGGTSVTSSPVTLTVQPASAPSLVTDTTASPSVASVAGNETFSASFVGTLPISYQWQVSPNANGSGAINIPGATNTTLILSNLQLTNSGYYYSLLATNTVVPYSASSSWLQLTVQPLTPLVQFVATNYIPGSAQWNDSSGNGNTAYYTGTTPPTLASFVTPNGSSAVNISSGSGSFLFSSSLDPSAGYTVFAYVMPTNTTGRHALTGGSSSGALEYDVYNGKQDFLQEYQVDVASGTNTVPTNSFSLIDLAVNSSAYSFRFNGSPSVSGTGVSFSSPITRIGNNEGAGDGFVGLIAEIDIYSGALSSIQISNVEAQLKAEYVTASTVVIGAATASPTNNVFAGTSVTLGAPIIGSNGTTTYQWQTDNGSGGASFSNINGATTTNYVLNTTSLNGTYEYQLIGTPFGGSSVTSSPVTLTVQPASAPSLVTDTTATPSVASIYGNDTLSASFVGTLPISYQWQVSPNANGSGAINIPGATNSTLVLTNLQLTNSGYYYSLLATNAVNPYSASSSWFQLSVQPLTPLVQLIANNFNAANGVWTDSSGSGNNATYSGTNNPTLVASATPNGSSAVNIVPGNGQYFLLSSSLDPSSGYTAFAYVELSRTSGRNALTGGSSGGALEWDVYNGNDDFLQEYQLDVAHGTATVPTNSFSLIDLAVNSSAYSFRFNGTADGSGTGVSFSQPITRIGNNEGGGDGFAGQIAELDIYSGALTAVQVSNVEAQLTAKYGTPGTVAAALTGLKFISNPVISGTSLTISATNTGAGTVYLLTSTNVANPLNTWTPVWTNVLSGNGSFTTNLTGVVNPALKQQFYILSNTHN